ncbi:conjugative transposon protein TraM [Pedobacter borealis]|uniref:conjugative transposon protein TraM n=1 Tax=Pedobacter borealis TaxID=475254 RepID=UPI00068E194C|nr:conjugative transposon protein TraM [Pedobacter borealis]
MKTNSEQFLKKRKFLLVLPFLVLPFITLAFWAMGGGTGRPESNVPDQKGFNKELPGANLSTDPVDKMSLYNKAAKDSINLHSGNKNFPSEDSLQRMPEDPFATDSYAQGATGMNGYRGYQDPNETKVRDRLAALERALSQPSVQGSGDYRQQGGYSSEPASISADIDRLEAMMKSMSSGTAADPEMQALNGMLEKISEIQNPGLAQAKLKELSVKNKGQVYAVSTYLPSKEADMIGRKVDVATKQSSSAPVLAGNSFYEIDGPVLSDSMQTAIPAVVHETQTVVSGSTIKMRLEEDIFINGTLIPAGNFIFGTCEVSGERLRVQIEGVRFGKSLFPVSLNVYDLDAIAGIHIPGAIARDAVKDGSDRGLQSVQFMSLDPSIASQAAGVGVEAAKGLFGKKAKMIRVTVKAGYPILLMDDKTLQQQSN